MKFIAILILSSSLILPSVAMASNLSMAAAMSTLTVSAKSANKAGGQLRVKNSQQAIQIVKRQYPGDVLKVDSRRVNGNPGYRVKMLSKKGTVFYISVDAKTGRLFRN